MNHLRRIERDRQKYFQRARELKEKLLKEGYTCENTGLKQDYTWEGAARYFDHICHIPVKEVVRHIPGKEALNGDALSNADVLSKENGDQQGLVSVEIDKTDEFDMKKKKGADKDKRRLDQYNTFKSYLASALSEHRHLPTQGFETTVRISLELERIG